MRLEYGTHLEKPLPGVMVIPLEHSQVLLASETMEARRKRLFHSSLFAENGAQYEKIKVQERVIETKKSVEKILHILR